MIQQNALELAKQGNSKAIAVLVNQSLKRKGITVRATLKDNCLHVVLESVLTPDQHALVPFVRQEVIELGVKAIKAMRVYGRQRGKEFSSWISEFIFEAVIRPLPVAPVDHPMRQVQSTPTPASAKPETLANNLPTITPAEVKRLGAYLVEADLVTEAQVEVALADQKATGVRFGEILVARGWLRLKTIEYLMEKIISPERESAKGGSSSHPESEQSLEHQNSVPALTKSDKKSPHERKTLIDERETLIVDNFFDA